MKILVAGAGGFIGGHLVNRLIEDGYDVKAVDIKPLDEWFQLSEKANNFSKDMTLLENCLELVEGVDEVINMACNMGGMGFIENNKALCMLSVLVNTHMLIACKKFKVKKYFFSSSACVYNADKQKDPNITGLPETDAYPVPLSASTVKSGCPRTPSDTTDCNVPASVLFGSVKPTTGAIVYPEPGFNTRISDK